MSNIFLMGSFFSSLCVIAPDGNTAYDETYLLVLLISAKIFRQTMLIKLFEVVIVIGLIGLTK